jgi:hypothetical protein
MKPVLAAGRPGDAQKHREDAVDVGSVLLFWVVFSVVVAGAHLFAARAAPPGIE